MPFTFFAHQAPVLPLKVARPSWFAGLALVIGSMAPDFEYFIRGEPVSTLSHTLPGQFIFCLPLTVLVVLIVERMLAPTLPEHLPDLGPFHLRDYAALANRRRDFSAWLKAGASALIGSFTHIAWDGFTHGHGWAVARLPGLKGTAVVLLGHEVAVYKLLQHGSTALGGAVTLGLLLLIGRRRLLLSWRGRQQTPIEPTRKSYALLSASVVAALLIGTGISLASTARDNDLPRVIVCAFLRATSTTFVGVCVGSVLASRLVSRHPGLGSDAA